MHYEGEEELLDEIRWQLGSEIKIDEVCETVEVYGLNVYRGGMKELGDDGRWGLQAILTWRSGERYL